MCFSATVSFGAGAILAGAGVVSMKKTRNPKMLLFASMPLAFSLHQLAEGVVWLSLRNPEWAAWQSPATCFYLFVAQLTWPLCVPLAIWLMEPNPGRKKILFYVMITGVAFAIYLAYCFMTYEVSASVEGRHIRYTMDFPHLNLRRVWYVIPTLAPLFLSSLKWMKLLAVAFTVSLIVTFIFYSKTVISVWCFFAALLSALVLLVVMTYNREVAGNASGA